MTPARQSNPSLSHSSFLFATLPRQHTFEKMASHYAQQSPLTLTHFILSTTRQFPQATGEFAILMNAIETASKFIASKVRAAGFVAFCFVLFFLFFLFFFPFGVGKPIPSSSFTQLQKIVS